MLEARKAKDGDCGCEKMGLQGFSEPAGSCAEGKEKKKRKKDRERETSSRS